MTKTEWLASLPKKVLNGIDRDNSGRYRVFLDGECVGFFSTRREAQNKFDDLVYLPPIPEDVLNNIRKRYLLYTKGR